MKYSIPDDWPLETGGWQCVQIQWPNSELWTRILVSVLSEMFRGRIWDERTGSIKDTQLIGREIWARNEALVSCVDCPDCPVDENSNTCGSGILVEGEEDMGQVVTDVYIDTSTGELVVEFGPCCVKRYTVGAGADLPDGYEPPAGGTGGDEYFACGKAWGVVHAIWSLMMSMWDHCDEITPFPWAGVEAENPNWSINKWPSGFGAMNYLRDCKLGGYDAPAEYFDKEQEVLCRVLPLFTSTSADDLADDAKWTSFKAAFQGLESDLLFGLTLNGYWSFVFEGAALGLGDPMLKRSEIQTAALSNAGDNTRDCSCPTGPDPELPDGYDWVYSWDFTAQNPLTSDWSISGGDHMDSSGLWSDPAAPYGNYNFTAQAPPTSADATSVIKYAKLFIESGTTEIDNNEVPLSILYGIPIVLIPRGAFGASMPGGAVTRLWASADGVVMDNAAALQINQAGFTNNVAANLYVKRLVIAGDGTPPYGTI